jgi:dTDP-4-dehydrorhamnose reductase
MAKVLILGAQGMLGSMVARVLAGRPDLQLTTTARRDLVGRRDLRFDVRRDSIGDLLDRDAYDWIVNAIGVTNAHINEHAAESIEAAIAVNALFPYRLAAEAGRRGQRVIQIATDGVYSGDVGAYDESAEHDPRDVYGRTKSLGETPTENVWHLRCSIVGPERGTPTSLLGWVLSAAQNAELTGYDGHRWNGITTLHFAKLCAAIITGAEVPNLQHVVPGDSVSKAELLEMALSAFGRSDVSVRHVPGPGAPVDRTLTTRDLSANQRLWEAAGYERPPTIETMLTELAGAEREHVAGAR